MTKLTIAPSTTAFSLQKLTARVALKRKRHTLHHHSWSVQVKVITAWGEVSPHLPLHPPDKVGRGGEVLEPGHTDRPLGLYLGASLAQRQRKARTEDPCIRSAELDLSVAGSVAGRGFPAVTGASMGPLRSSPMP